MNNKKVFHYTSSVALINILNTGYLRATHAWHLDDGSECRYAIDLLRQICPEIAQSYLWKSLENMLLEQPRYVVCFSKIRNDPYQWREYGGCGSGVCFVLDPELLKAANPPGMWDRFECEYDESIQKKKLKALALDLSRRGQVAVNERINEFWAQNISFKQARFSQESEIRYVFNSLRGARFLPATREDVEVRNFWREISGNPENLGNPSGLFDERHRPFEPFEIKGAISEIILGPRFTATLPYMKFLERRFPVCQIGVDNRENLAWRFPSTSPICLSTSPTLHPAAPPHLARLNRYRLVPHS